MSTQMRFSGEFRDELETTFQVIKRPKLLAEFFAEMTKANESLRRPRLTEQFISELNETSSAFCQESTANLPILATRFEGWRRLTREALQSSLVRLPADDPLRCPISLFRTIGYGRLETAHTRTLAWLLDPAAEHGFGDALLGSLLRRLSGRRDLETIKNVTVVSECQVAGLGAKGRLDVLAECRNSATGDRVGWVLAIEAKIGAWEGERQLAKYDTWLKSHAGRREIVRVFLTPDGRESESASDEWESMSYLELVRVFRAVYDGLRDAPGFHFLRFYLSGVLQDVSGWPRHITADASDPYSVAAYLKNAVESFGKGVEQ